MDTYQLLQEKPHTDTLAWGGQTEVGGRTKRGEKGEEWGGDWGGEAGVNAGKRAISEAAVPVILYHPSQP